MNIHCISRRAVISRKVHDSVCATSVLHQPKNIQLLCLVALLTLWRQKVYLCLLSGSKRLVESILGSEMKTHGQKGYLTEVWFDERRLSAAAELKDIEGMETVALA